MKIKRSILLPIALILLVSPCLAQSYKFATVHTKSFSDPKRGIIRLVRAISYCQTERQNGYERCMNENTAPIVEDIAKSLSAFSESRRLILVDADSNYEDYCIIEGDVSDITREFIDEYNRARILERAI